MALNKINISNLSIPSLPSPTINPKKTMLLLKSAALPKPSKSRPPPPPPPPPQPQQAGVSESLTAEIVEAVDVFIRHWVTPHYHDPSSSSSSSSCSLSSLFTAANRPEGRRFLDALAKLQNAIHNAVSANHDPALLSNAKESMQTAMKHMEKEFYRVLKSNQRFLDPKSVSAWSSRSNETISDSESESSGNEGAEAITDLKMIANCMISSGHEKDCVKIYKKIRKTIIADALSHIGFEKVTSGAQMQKLEWQILEKKIKTWRHATKEAITTLFNGERILCDHVFSSVSSIAESSFADITLQSALKLFILPVNIAKCRKSAEKIFPTLDVYQTILHLTPKIEEVFNYDSTAAVRSQAAESLKKLEESVNAMMTEFKLSITKESSKSPITGGGVHQLTRYVMNFIVFLADYTDSLVVILKESSLPLPEDYYRNGGGNSEENPGSAGSPMAARIAWLILVLLCKIDAKSRLYNDSSLSYLFLANNLHYIVTKVRTSNLRIVLGDDWVKNHEVKVSQYLEKYEKMAWGDAITSLPGEPTAESEAEESMKRFNDAFYEAYKKHKTWVVPDPKLRDEIKASVAGKLVPGYTVFFEKYPVGSIGRFTPEDLNNYISDLYIGIGGSVPGSTVKPDNAQCKA